MSFRFSQTRLWMGAAAVLLGLTVALPATGLAAEAKKMDKNRPKPNPKMQTWMENLARSGFPPILKAFSFNPAKPKAGQKIAVNATFVHDLTNATKEAKANKHIVNKAWISFSSDGGKRWAFPAMMKMSKPGVFSGVIPPQKAGTLLLVKLRAQDNHGNVYSEIACKVTGDPIVDPCMSEAGMDETPLDDPALSVPDSHDYLKVRIGYDGTKAYVVQSVQGKISGGTLNPMKVSAYMASFVESKNPKNLQELFSTGNLLLYAPLAKAVTGQARAGGNSDVPTIAPCGIMNARPGAEKAKKAEDAFRQDTANVTCKAQGSNLILTVNWNGLNKKFRESFRFLSADMVITSLIPPNFDLKDWTRPTQMVIKNHSVKVQ